MIAIIGTGKIGGTLGRAFARTGLEVVFGSRNPAGSMAAGDTPARAVTVGEAVAAGDVVLLAQPAQEVVAFLRANAPALDNKLIVDATNNFPGPVLHCAVAVAEHAPGARYARAFSSQTWETYEEPTWAGTPGDLVFTSEETDRAEVEELINAVGLHPVYLGPGQQDLVDAVLRLLVPEWAEHGRHVGLRILTDDRASHP